MESKVLLFDANDVKVGETFVRRARQLVKQQRAEWVDESQTAIRFAPDVEDWDKEVLPASTASTEPKDCDRLYAFAKKRIHERKMFFMHTVGLIPGYFLLVILFAPMGDTEWIFWFLSGGWTASYAIHAYHFIKTHMKGFRMVDREARRAQKIALEMDKLKMMGYVDI